MEGPVRRESGSPQRTAKATVVRFLSRAGQLRTRGIRNFGRFMTKTGPYTHPDPQERARLEREQIQDDQDDGDWNRRHGPVPGGAKILRWPHKHYGEREDSLNVHNREHQVTR